MLRSHDSAHDCWSHGLELHYVLCAKVVHAFFCWPHILPKNTEELVKGLCVSNLMNKLALEEAPSSGKGSQNYNPNFTGRSLVTGVVFLVISRLIAW